MALMDDLLGIVIERTRLHGQLFCQTEARPPWGLSIAARPEAMFHQLRVGCWPAVDRAG